MPHHTEEGLCTSPTPTSSVPVKIKVVYKKELQQLCNERIITPVQEHTEWTNSIVNVRKAEGSLRLCLDPKDLNKNIERNQYYTRTIDNLSAELHRSKYFTLKDAKSGYWMVQLDRESSQLMMFKTPWGKYRWLWLPLGLLVSLDVFQES